MGYVIILPHKTEYAYIMPLTAFLLMLVSYPILPGYSTQIAGHITLKVESFNFCVRYQYKIFRVAINRKHCEQKLEMSPL